MHPSDSDDDPDVTAPDPGRSTPDQHDADDHDADDHDAEAVFDPDAARLWLWAAGSSPGAGRAVSSAWSSAWSSALMSAVASLIDRAHEDSLPEVLAELVDHVSEANVFGADRRLTLWYDRDPEGRIIGWHVTVELIGEGLRSPDGHRLRLAGTWAPAWTLWSPEDDLTGTEGLVVALGRVADDAEDTMARSFAALPRAASGARRGAEGNPP